ncbi:hypothetical protein EIP91_007821 [Steccherinum ochraceum]|uniref:Uncharacterized protein n=1 Tax=Steccherinum ochraceum TaxID=92696 RepID=A0A4R0R3V6_9APHY|nr:hypothetical protein EIP91_007821 [Steccherinum ochraceum]
MKLFLASLTTIGFMAGALASDVLLVNTPASAVQCEDTLLTWSGGVPPFNLL